MSAEMIASVGCDGKQMGAGPCFARFVTVAAGSVKQARMFAKTEGWLHKDGKDYCPECAKKVRGEK